jgi:hypothetical protein
MLMNTSWISIRVNLETYSSIQTRLITSQAVFGEVIVEAGHSLFSLVRGATPPEHRLSGVVRKSKQNESEGG